MPLIQCPECKKEISDKAPACPGCGYELKPQNVTVVVKEKKKIGCFTYLIILVVGLVIIGTIGELTKKDKSQTSGVNSQNTKIDFSLFIQQHPEMNIAYKVIKEQQIGNWKDGERFIVTTTTGVYYFFLKNGKIVTVKEESPTGKELYRAK